MSIDESAAPPVIKRPRGRLEELVREVCDLVAQGSLQLPEGQSWTPHRLSAEIAERFPGSGVKPSTGAIADTLKRWDGLGFAHVSYEPLSFQGYTDEGQSEGLTALKARAREARAAVRRKATAAEAGQEGPAVGAEDAEGRGRSVVTSVVTTESAVLDGDYSATEADDAPF